MTSSLCFVASTAGSVSRLTHKVEVDTHRSFRSVRFAIGTILVERILGYVGWVYVQPNSRNVILSSLLRRRTEGSVRGYSASYARFVVTWACTLLHPVFFVIMGCRRNFASMLIAYAISAFSRSLLNGKVTPWNQSVQSNVSLTPPPANM